MGREASQMESWEDLSKLEKLVSTEPAPVLCSDLRDSLLDLKLQLKVYSRRL